MRRSRPIAHHLLAAALAWSSAELPAWAEAPDAGRALFDGACATCHAAGSPRVLAGQPLLGHTRAITGSDPSAAIRIVLEGQQPPAEQRGPWMPGFATILTDAQVAEILNWLRREANQPPWPRLEQQVKAQR